MSVKIIGRTVAASMLALSGLAVAAPADAAGQEQMYWTGGTKSQCLQVQRTYSSSWTKITRSCYRNGNGWAFHWRPIA